MHTTTAAAFLAILAASTPAACREPLPQVTAARPVSPECAPVSSDGHFFPRDIALSEHEADALRLGTHLGAISTSAFVSQFLVTMGEPSLSCGADPSLEAYRFIWTSAFGNEQPVVIRIMRDSTSAWSIRAARFKNHVNRTIAVRTERMLSDEEDRVVTAAIQASQFWTVPTLLWAHDRDSWGRWKPLDS